jgi:beta-galactosidase
MSSYDLYAPPGRCRPRPSGGGSTRIRSRSANSSGPASTTSASPRPTTPTTNLLNYSDPAERERAAKELAEIGRIRVPSRSSYFGIIDLAGFPKDRYYLYQSRWRPDLPMAHILPHWNWPERVGQVTPVHVYTSGDEAELFLNGQSLGRKKKGPRANTASAGTT